MFDTILNEDLRACEASVNGGHVQGALPFFALWAEAEVCKLKWKVASGGQFPPRPRGPDGPGALHSYGQDRGKWG